MSSGMFRGKESSNRIELSRLVQDLLNFGVLGSLWLWGGGCMGVGGGWDVPPTHVHTHTHACMCTHTHIHVKHDNFNCKWQPPLGESLGIPYDVTRVHACVHVHASACMCTCMGGTPQPPSTPSTHPHPQGDPWNQSKFNST